MGHKDPNIKEGGKNYYSGKKKRYTLKLRLMVYKEGKILNKSNKHKKGRQHDYSVYNDEHPITPSQVENYVDLGCYGIEKNFLDLKAVL